MSSGGGGVPPRPTVPAPMEAPEGWGSQSLISEAIQMAEVEEKLKQFKMASASVLERTIAKLQQVINEHQMAMQKVFQLTLPMVPQVSFSDTAQQIIQTLSTHTHTTIVQTKRLVRNDACRKAEQITAIIKVQSMIRGFLTRKRYNKEMKLVERRTKSQMEIVTSERTYRSNLQILVDIYMKTLSGPNPAAPHASICSPNTIQSIFSNVELILNLSNELLSKIEKRMKVMNTGFFLADIFVEFTPFFKLYIQYVNNYDKAISKYTAQVNVIPN